MSPTRSGVLVAVWSSVALAAAPAITSQASTTVAFNEVYHYDADDLPTATGTGPIEWSLVTAPAGMELDNLTGQIFYFAGAMGSFPVELQARNAEGVATQPFTLSVTSPAPPGIAPVNVTQVSQGDLVQLQLSATGAQPIAWAMTQGPATAALNPTTGALSWATSALGPVTFTFTATNHVGSAQLVWNVSVVDSALPAPTAALAPVPPGDVPLVVTLDASGSRSNEPADAFVSHTWDFGDGTPTRVGVLPSLVHGYPLPGSYNVRLTVSNVHLKTDAAAITVVASTQGGTPPQARIVLTPESGAAPLSVSLRCDCVAGTAPLVLWEWEYGDGEGSTREAPSHVFAKPAGYNVKLHVTDALGFEAFDSVYLPVGTGTRLPPFARARANPAAGDGPLTTQLYAEFGDPDGIVVSRRWQLPDGTVYLDLDPMVTFSIVGTERLKLTVADSDGLESVDTLDLRVTRNGVLPPHLISTPRLSAEVGKPYAYDDDGRAAARGGAPLFWELGKVVGGQRVNVPEGCTVDAANGRLTWTPVESQVGAQPIALVVSNRAGADVQEFTVEVVGTRGDLGVHCGCGSGTGLLALAAALCLLRRQARHSTRRLNGAAGHVARVLHRRQLKR